MNQPESFSQSWDQQRWCNLAEPVEQAIKHFSHLVDQLMEVFQQL